MDEAPFGTQLYDALKRIGRAHVITRELKYAEVQRLKAGGRAEVVELFRGSSYEIVQLIKTGSPKAVADRLSKRVDEQERANLATVVLLGRVL